MILEFLMSPIADKNTFTGGIIDGYCKRKDFRRREEISLREREVRALEELASANRDRRLNPK